MGEGKREVTWKYPLHYPLQCGMLQNDIGGRPG
jgi:hypothetical protein